MTLRDTLWPNVRRMRAMTLAAAVFDAIRPHVADLRNDDWRAVHDAILALFVDRGYEVLSDHDRDQYGLPPRGPDGWTIEELIALEQKRLAALLAPTSDN